MEIYKQQSVPLGLEAAQKALHDSKLKNSDITHLITVSCTGLFLPGMDVALIQQLELAADVNRIPLTFLGCAAGLTAVRMSREIVERNPSSKVLIVCVELCTLHIQPSGEREALFAAAFFGDGASACIVGTTGASQKGVFALGSHRAAIFPGSTDDMTWNVGNFGFHLYLSPLIPKLIGERIPLEIQRLLDGSPMPDLWAIHPGGRGIIDTLQTLFTLTDDQTRISRSILRRYGNLSSATILFVLDEMRRELENLARTPKEGIALAFGPGLTAEIMRITYIPSVYLQEAVQGEVCV
jgi:predicted naringenin-chalcone synthase